MAVTASETKAGRNWLLAPPAVALLAGALAAIHSRRPLTLAESEYVLQSQRPWHELVPVWHVNARSSVYLVLLRGWLHAGSGEWFARLPSIMAVAVTAAAVYAIGARLFDRRSGLAAAALFAASASTTGIGREVGPLALAVLAATVATRLFVVARESGGPAAWAGYGVAAVTSVYIHPTCALVLVGHAAVLIVGPRPTGRRWAVAPVVVTALAAPAVVCALATHPHVLDVLRQPTLGDAARAAHDASGKNLLLLVLAAGGIAVLAARLPAPAQASRLTLLGAWAGAPLVGVLILSIARPSLDPRYLAVGAPAVCVLAGVGLVARLRWQVGVVSAVAALLVSGVRLYQLERSTPENWPAAIAYARVSQGEHDRIVVAPPRAITAFSFYAGPGRGSLNAGGPRVFVVVRALDDALALKLSRRAVRVPAYALRGERRFGSHLWVQEWDRTGLPS